MCILARAKEEYPALYERCFKTTKRDALCALSVQTSHKNKLRAVIMRFFPGIIPLVMKARKVR